MAERAKLSAKEVLSDIRAGATDQFLMKKYALSEKGLQSLFQKLVAASIMSEQDLEGRIRPEPKPLMGLNSTHEIPNPNGHAFRCPSCGLPQNYEFKVCPQCGIIVEKFLRKTIVVEKPVERPEPEINEPPDHVVSSPLERLQTFGNRAIESALNFRGRAIEFLQVPKNAVLVGTIGLVVSLIAVAITITGLTKTYGTRESRVTQQQTIPTPHKASVPNLEPVKRDSRNSTLPDPEATPSPTSPYLQPVRTSRNSTLPSEPQVTPPPTVTKPSPPPSPKSPSSKKFSSMDEAKRAFNCKDGVDYLCDFPSDDSSKLTKWFSRSEPSTLYYFAGEVTQASRSSAVCTIGIGGEGTKFVVDLQGIPLSYKIPYKEQ